MAFLTVIKTRQPQTKNIATLEGYPKTSRVEAVQAYGFDTLKTLAKILRGLESVTNSCVIRGELRDESDRPEGVVRRRKTHFADTAQAWVMLDIDAVRLPRDLRTTPYDRRHAAYARSLLPPEFVSVGCVWTASASAGVDRRTLKLHLWFLLDKPTTAAQLRKWLVGCSTIDPAVFRTVQPHYTAAPLGSKGVYDGKRTGILKGTADSVVVPSRLGEGKVAYDAQEILPRAAGTHDVTARRVAATKKHVLAECAAILARSADIGGGYNVARDVGCQIGLWLAAKTWNDAEHGHEVWEAEARRQAADWASQVLVVADGTYDPGTLAIRVMQGIAFSVAEERQRLALAIPVAAAQRTLAAAAQAHAGKPDAAARVSAELGCAPATAAAALADVPDWRAGLLLRAKTDEIEATAANVVQILTRYPELLASMRLNVRSAELHFSEDNQLGVRKGAVHPDTLTQRLLSWLNELGCRRVGFQMVEKAMQLVMPDVVQYDPFCEKFPEMFLEQEAAAHELARIAKPKLDTWLSDFYGVKDTKLHRAYAAYSLIGGIARAVAPGARVDSMLVLVGEEGGEGKTSVARALGNVIPDGYGEWLDNRSDKDALMEMQGALIAEANELSALSGRKSDSVKAFVTRTTDRYRLPYGKHARAYPRRFIFMGSTNEPEFLVETHNRRFWPVVTKGSYVMGQEQAVELWREAALRYAASAQPVWWLTDKLDAAQRKTSLKHRRGDAVVEDKLIPYIAARHDERLSMAELITLVFPGVVGAGYSHEKRVATVLKAQGFVRKHTMKGSRWFYQG